MNVLTITLAVVGVAIAGGFFGIYGTLKQKLENDIKKKATSEMDIEKARFFISHGHMYWLDYKISNSEDTVKIRFLKQAISETEKGLGLIKDLKSDNAEDYLRKEIIKCSGRNNLSYYYYKLPEDEKLKGTDELADTYAKYVYNKISLFPDYRGTWTDTYNKIVLKQED